MAATLRHHAPEPAHDGDDHEILVERVLRVVTNETKTPLVSVRGGLLNA